MCSSSRSRLHLICLPRVPCAPSYGSMSNKIGMCSLLGQQLGMTTLRVTSRAGRLTQAAHVFVIVRNLVDAAAADSVGRVRLLPPDAEGNQVTLCHLDDIVCSMCHPQRPSVCACLLGLAVHEMLHTADLGSFTGIAVSS